MDFRIKIYVHVHAQPFGKYNKIKKILGYFDEFVSSIIGSSVECFT